MAGTVGLLWFDNSKRGVAERAAPAVRRFCERTGETPRAVLVPQGEADVETFDGLQVLEWGPVMPGYLLVTAQVEG